MSVKKFQKFEFLKSLLPLIKCSFFSYETSIIVKSSSNICTLNILKNHINFRCNLLSCISGVDFLSTTYRFCIVYELLSVVYNFRIRIKSFITEHSSIFSIISIFVNANWWEREIWDLYGIYFENHNDLRRLLTDYGFDGHPMRKTFPLFGYVELRYNETKKKIVSYRAQFTQEFREFSFENPWND